MPQGQKADATSQEREPIYRRLWAQHSEAAGQLENLQERIGYEFNDLHRLYEALTHRSALTELGCHADFAELPWNERLEFLGDAVLGLAISHRLMRRQEEFSEGELSRIRAGLVNEESLAQIARRLQLGSCLALGKGEERAGGRQRAALLADGLEALLAAIFFDGGFAAADQVVGRLFSEQLSGEIHDLTQADFKTMLQEVTQGRCQKTPSYAVLAESGPDHDKSFVVACSLDDEELGVGRGASKKRASQEAARAALATLASKDPTKIQQKDPTK